MRRGWGLGMNRLFGSMMTSFVMYLEFTFVRILTQLLLQQFSKRQYKRVKARPDFAHVFTRYTKLQDGIKRS